MNEEERIEKVVTELFTQDPLSGNINLKECENTEEFKSSMLKILLPWRDFEKEKPKNDSLIILKTNVGDFLEIKWCAYHRNTQHRLWIYKSELLTTLPKEET